MFVGICLFFSLLTHRASLATPTEPLRDTKLVTRGLECGLSKIHIYCGNIRHLDGEVGAIVTSEDTDLELGRLSGNAVSERARRMAADLAVTGDVVKDNLREGLDIWKLAQSHQSPFGLNTVVSQDSFGAARYGIRRIFHAVVIEKVDRLAFVNESAVQVGMRTISWTTWR